MKIKRGASAISLSTYKQYQDYLIFNSGHFTINEETVARQKETFKTYADTPQKIKVATFWESLCIILDQYHDRYPISDEDKRTIGKAMKLQLSEGFRGKFVVNPEALSNEIKYMK
jgi:hypothetical protein